MHGFLVNRWPVIRLLYSRLVAAVQVTEVAVVALVAEVAVVAGSVIVVALAAEVVAEVGSVIVVAEVAEVDSVAVAAEAAWSGKKESRALKARRCHSNLAYVGFRFRVSR
jgi:hypothetical protein